MASPTNQDLAAANKFCQDSVPVRYNMSDQPKPYILGISSNDSKILFAQLTVSTTETIIEEKLLKFKKVYFSRYNNFASINKINVHYLEDVVKKTLTKLYSFTPDALALEMTSDDSIFISLRRGNKKAYLEYFPENAALGIEQFVLNGYENGEEVINSFSGSLNDVISYLGNNLMTDNLNNFKDSSELRFYNVNLPVNSVTSRELQVY